MIKIAVTGPISSGKSTVCKILAKHNAYVISADELTHKLLQTDGSIQQEILKLLNRKISFENDEYRQQISSRVFSDPELLHKLELILHPKVIELIKNQYATCQQKNIYPYFVCEVPLLFETGLNTFFDVICYIQADQAVCQDRFCTKNQATPQAFTHRMKRFNSTDLNRSKASFVITNNGSRQELETQVNLFLKSLPHN